MRSALGDYPANRDASGTSWQPDSGEHVGWMMKAGEWDLMVHGNFDLIGSTQSGRRGDDKIFPAGMLMGMATRQFSNGNALQFRGMISPDPLMGKSGYPLLLASGETANGTDRLIDRLFGGRVSPLVAQLAEQRALDPEDLAELEELVRRLRK